MPDSSTGVTGGLTTTLPIAMTLSAFCGIAWYNCVELNVRILIVFKRYRGLYFWSLVLSSWGASIMLIVLLLKFFHVWYDVYIALTIILICWYTMVTGQSLVLYSRLHLIVPDARKIRWILYMIIIDAIIFHVPATVLSYGVNDIPIKM
jgi:hypothetical protein